MKKHVIINGELVRVPKVELKEHETDKYKIIHSRYGWTIKKKGKYELCDTVYIGEDEDLKTINDFNEYCIGLFRFELIEPIGE